jgi:hypothetical protein
VTSATLSSELIAITLSGMASFKRTKLAFDVIANATGATGTTDTVAVALTDSALARKTAFPSLAAVTMPSASVDATLESEEVQTTPETSSDLLPSRYWAITINFFREPLGIDGALGTMAMASSFLNRKCGWK